MLEWRPTLSIKAFGLHLWIGRQESDGRNIYGLVEEIDSSEIGFKIHWLSANIPMFALFVWPEPVVYFFWLHSHDVMKGAE